MKKLILAATILLFTCSAANSQSRGDLFLIGTPKPIPETERGIFDGFGVCTLAKREILLHPTTMYSIGSKSKDYDISFFHKNYDIEKIKRLAPHMRYPESNMKIVEMPLNELTRNYVVTYVDSFFKNKSKEEVLQWGNRYNEGRAWIIDKNKFYTDDNGQVIATLIETRVFVPDWEMYNDAEVIEK